MKSRKIFTALLLLNSVILSAAQTTVASQRQAFGSEIFFGAKFYRTELYFGLNKKDGGTVSVKDWDEFLESEVTPRFSEGFTVLDGYGQYKDSNEKIVREASRVLVLFYPKKERAAFDSKIEAVRAAYKKRFDQESILRLDFRQTVAVSF